MMFGQCSRDAFKVNGVCGVVLNMSTIAMAKSAQYMYATGYRTYKMQSCTVTQLLYY